MISYDISHRVCSDKGFPGLTCSWSLRHRFQYLGGAKGPSFGSARNPGAHWERDTVFHPEARTEIYEFGPCCWANVTFFRGLFQATTAWWLFESACNDVKPGLLIPSLDTNPGSANSPWNSSLVQKKAPASDSPSGDPLYPRNRGTARRAPEKWPVTSRIAYNGPSVGLSVTFHMKWLQWLGSACGKLPENKAKKFRVTSRHRFRRFRTSSRHQWF